MPSIGRTIRACRRHRSLVALSVIFALLPLAGADIGIITFWIPELYALLRVIQEEGGSIVTHTFGGRRFYVTSYRGHNVIAVNGGESISNSAATTAILLQKFQNVDRIIGTGIAGGVVSIYHFCVIRFFPSSSNGSTKRHKNMAHCVNMPFDRIRIFASGTSLSHHDGHFTKSSTWPEHYAMALMTSEISIYMSSWEKIVGLVLNLTAQNHAKLVSIHGITHSCILSFLMAQIQTAPTRPSRAGEYIPIQTKILVLYVLN